jgi:hypothetical protein
MCPVLYRIDRAMAGVRSEGFAGGGRKLVGRHLPQSIRRLVELLRQYESQQWPLATAERFDTGLSSLVADREWRQGAALAAVAQKARAATLETAGMSAVSAASIPTMRSRNCDRQTEVKSCAMPRSCDGP